MKSMVSDITLKPLWVPDLHPRSQECVQSQEEFQIYVRSMLFSILKYKYIGALKGTLIGIILEIRNTLNLSGMLY